MWAKVAVVRTVTLWQSVWDFGVQMFVFGVDEQFVHFWLLAWTICHKDYTNSRPIVTRTNCVGRIVPRTKRWWTARQGTYKNLQINVQIIFLKWTVFQNNCKNGFFNAITTRVTICNQSWIWIRNKICWWKFRIQIQEKGPDLTKSRSATLLRRQVIDGHIRETMEAENNN
jgi:hypothetical protein